MRRLVSIALASVGLVSLFGCGGAVDVEDGPRAVGSGGSRGSNLAAGAGGAGTSGDGESAVATAGSGDEATTGGDSSTTGGNMTSGGGAVCAWALSLPASTCSAPGRLLKSRASIPRPAR